MTLFQRTGSGKSAIWWLLSALILIAGCEEPLPSSDMIDPSLVGYWKLDKNETLRRQTKVLRDAGVLKINQDVFDFKRSFMTFYFTLQLRDDASFTCDMSTFGQNGEFSGYWITEGDSISLMQTHAGMNKKGDKMAGTYDGKNLFLTHERDDVAVPYIFQRSEASVPADAEAQEPLNDDVD